MTREEKIKMAIEKGITCDINTGKVYGVRGKEFTGRNKGYIYINMKNDKKTYTIKAHQFIFYKKYSKIVEQIDHINGIRDDNRIENLREVTNQQNHFNQTTARGYGWDKKRKKWRAYICIDDTYLHLGYFVEEEDARQAYLDAKKIYHII